MVQLIELRGEPRETMPRAARVGVAVQANGQGQLQLRSSAPFVLGVNTEVIGVDALLQALREALAVLTDDAIREIGNGQDPSPSDGTDTENGIGNVVSAEISAELQPVITLVDGHVV